MNIYLRWFAVSALVIGMVVALFLMAPEPQKKLGQGDVAIAVTLPDLQGNPHSLVKGDVMLLHFWATWCTPCRAEIPSMIKVYNQFKDDGLNILAVSTDQSGDDIRDFIDMFHINFQVVRDVDMAIANRYGITGYPETYIIDRNGVIQKHIIGPAPWEDANMQAWLKQLLQQAPQRNEQSTAAVRQPES